MRNRKSFAKKIIIPVVVVSAVFFIGLGSLEKAERERIVEHNKTFPVEWLNEKYPNCEIKYSEEISKYDGGWGLFSGPPIKEGMRYTLFDNENGFYFDQTFTYWDKNKLKPDETNEAVYKEGLGRRKLCQYIKENISDLTDCEVFIEDSSEYDRGIYIFLKTPSFEQLSEFLKALADKDTEYTFDEKNGKIRWAAYTVYALDEKMFDKSKNTDWGMNFYINGGSFLNLLEEKFGFSCEDLELEFNKMNYEKYIATDADNNRGGFDSYVLVYRPNNYSAVDDFYGINF